MKVRTRSRLILVATLVIFLIVLSFVTQSVILQSFRTIEDKETSANVQRYIAQMNNEIEDVAATCRDWAARQETAEVFPASLEAGGSEHIFPPVSMKNLGIDYIIVYDAEGNIVFSETISKDGDTTPLVPRELDTIVRDSIIVNGIPGGIAGRRGMSAIGDNALILAGYPVPYGNLGESSTGTLVMARLLDKERIGDIDQRLQVDGIIELYHGSTDSAPLSPSEEKRAKDGAIIVRPVNDDQMEGLAVITGIENQPTFLLLKIWTPRPVFQQVERSIIIMAIAIIVLSIVFILMVQLLLQRFILAPLSELDNGMKSISSSGDLDLRISEQGDEEILSLTRSLNRMLDEIKSQQNEMQALLEEIGQQRDDLNETRQELAKRNSDLEELNRKANLYLDIYLDVITYEILNAIMGLRGYADLMKSTADETGQKFAEKIIDLASRSSDVIRNIETISRIYKNLPAIREVDLATAIKDEMGRRTGAHIILENCNRKVLADDMLGVIFDNIFANSLKFGGKDTEIQVSAQVIPGQMLEVSVTDNGPGIPDSVKHRVFDRFTADSRTRSSYGLGLHIVKMLVENYGGSVRADNRIPDDPHSGAAIRFTLRLSGE